jgi:hypothetical protein
VSEQPRGRRLLRVGQAQPQQLVAGGVDDACRVLGVGQVGVDRQEHVHDVGADQRLRRCQALVQLRRRALRRDEEQSPRGGVLVRGAQHAGEALREDVHSDLLGVRDRVFELPLRPVGLAVDERDEEAAEIAELLVDDRAGHARLGGDAVDRGGVEALGVDDRVGDVEDLLATVGRPHPPPGLGVDARHFVIA